MDFPWGKILQDLFFHFKDAAISAHPEIAGIIFQNSMNRVVQKPVVLCDVRSAAIFEPNQTLIQSCEPECSLWIDIDEIKINCVRAFYFKLNSDLSIFPTN